MNGRFLLLLPSSSLKCLRVIFFRDFLRLGNDQFTLNVHVNNIWFTQSVPLFPFNDYHRRSFVLLVRVLGLIDNYPFKKLSCIFQGEWYGLAYFSRFSQASYTHSHTLQWKTIALITAWIHMNALAFVACVDFVSSKCLCLTVWLQILRFT